MNPFYQKLVHRTIVPLSTSLVDIVWVSCGQTVRKFRKPICLYVNIQIEDIHNYSIFVERKIFLTTVFRTKMKKGLPKRRPFFISHSYLRLCNLGNMQNLFDPLDCPVQLFFADDKWWSKTNGRFMGFLAEQTQLFQLFAVWSRSCRQFQANE